MNGREKIASAIINAVTVSIRLPSFSSGLSDARQAFSVSATHGPLSLPASSNLHALPLS